MVAVCVLGAGPAEPPRCCSVYGEVVFNGRGDVHVDLVRRATFEKGQSNPDYLLVLRIGEEELRRGRVKFEFKDVPAGTYALRSFQDENGNGLLDTHFLGAPLEPWGMHRPSRPVMRAPRFDEVSFDLKSSVSGVEIVLDK